jgi:hypothetical protein
MRFNSHSGVIGRTFRAAIEIDIKLNLETSNIFLETRQAILNRRLFIEATRPILLAPLLGEPGKLIIFYGQGRSSNRAAQAGSPPLISV